jgi:L-fuculose-phosphate aldolase
MNAVDTSSEIAARELVQTMQYLESVGLNTGSAGNGSCRVGAEKYWITPSGVAPAALKTESIVSMSFGATAVPGPPTPSSEWRMHHDIYLARPDIGAIIHTHSSYATALACARKSIPAFHYMVAVAGGDSIRCAPYATFGTQELSDYAVAALAGRKACMLANHGVLALSASPMAAAKLAVEIEQLAKQYCLCVQSGDPVILSDEQMQDVLEKFENYGQRLE